jgi:molybdenum cofactor cytidylyltransferase
VKNIAAILLAAGMSRRMGAQKLLLEIEGEPMVRRAAATCRQAGLSPIIAVLGPEAERVQQALDGLDVTCIRNENFATGMAGSLTTGLAALPPDACGALIVLADMPFVTADDMRALCTAFAPKKGRAICIPVHDGKRGNPVLLGRQCFPALAMLSGDQGAKAFIQKNEDMVWEVPAGSGVLHDIDTPEAYAAHGGV